jgi:hypothetical protein
MAQRAAYGREFPKDVMLIARVGCGVDARGGVEEGLKRGPNV